MTNHTPSPWAIKHYDEDYFEITHTDKGGRFSLAEVYSKADAHLIAAAPELREALEELMELYIEAFRELGFSKALVPDDKLAGVSKAKAALEATEGQGHD
jgi:hypothetical protein